MTVSLPNVLPIKSTGFPIVSPQNVIFSREPPRHSVFRQRPDHIIIFRRRRLPLRRARRLLRYSLCGMVVEPSPVRSLAADCPIQILFIPSRIPLFHDYVVVKMALRGFQQFNRLLSNRISAKVAYSVKPVHAFPTQRISSYADTGSPARSSKLRTERICPVLGTRCR